MVNIREASQKKASEIISYVVERVQLGEWPAGHRMPTEKHLIEQFSAARNTVRKALAKLERDQIIVRHVGRGTFVWGGDDDAAKESQRVNLDDSSPAEINEIRVLLEPAIAELVVTRATSSDISYAQKCLAKTKTAKDVTEYEHWDAELHATLIKAARNNMLQGFYDVINKARKNVEWREIKTQSLDPRRVENYNKQHSDIVDALSRRDAMALREALKTHLETVSRNMLNPVF